MVTLTLEFKIAMFGVNRTMHLFMFQIEPLRIFFNMIKNHFSALAEQMEENESKVKCLVS